MVPNRLSFAKVDRRRVPVLTCLDLPQTNLNERHPSLIEA